MNSSPDVIRSISQGWLLRYWMGLRVASRLPPVQALDAEKLAAVCDNLLITQVVNANVNARFLIRFSGTRVAESFGASCTNRGEGRYLDEVLPASYCAAAHSTFHQVVAARKPVYTIADMRDQAGRIVHYERLLLPFGHDGIAVDRVLASLETVSPEGTFENRGLMKGASRPPAFALCTMIDISET